MLRKITGYKKVYMSSLEETRSIPIVGDAAIATVSVGHGRLVPLVIIDTATRGDIAELIRIHNHLPPGDVTVRWGQIKNRLTHVALIIDFQRPLETSAILEFEIVKQGIIVEHVLMSKGLYIQSGKPGDRLKNDLKLPKILLEIPDTGFQKYWDRIYHRAIMRRARQDGVGRGEAKSASRRYIQSIRELAKFKVK
jgi:hypothetical protein